MNVLTVGGVSLDILATVADSAIGRMTMHDPASSYLLLEAGKKLEATSIVEESGGGAANTAVSLARQGATVSVLGKIGTDPGAAFVRARLAEEGVDASNVLVSPTTATGTSVIITASDRDPTVLVARGANTELTQEEVRPAAFAGKDLVCVTNLSGPSADCFPIAVARAHEAGAHVLSIPGIRQLTSRGDVLLKALQHIDTLIFNRAEASALVPLIAREEKPDGSLRYLCEDNLAPGETPRLLAGGLESGGFILSLAAYARALFDRGLTTLGITDGAYGAYLMRGDRLAYCPALPSDTVASVGGGDAFASTATGALVRGASLEEAALRGSVNAASVVSSLDTQTGLLRTDELDRRMDEVPAGTLRVFTTRSC